MCFSERYRRPVTHSDAETERRALLIKDWTRYRHQEHKTQTRMIATALQCQDRALQELRNISEELYQEAIQVCITSIGRASLAEIFKIKLE